MRLTDDSTTAILLYASDITNKSNQQQQHHQHHQQQQYFNNDDTSLPTPTKKLKTMHLNSNNTDYMNISPTNSDTSNNNDNDNNTIHYDINKGCILSRLPSDLLEYCLLYLSGAELLTTLNLTCKHIHNILIHNDSLWLSLLNQLKQQYISYNGPNINSISLFINHNYYTLYRSLSPYIGIFDHFQINNTVLGQLVCCKFDYNTQSILIEQINCDNQLNDSVLIGRILLSPLQHSTVYLYGYSYDNNIDDINNNITTDNTTEHIGSLEQILATPSSDDIVYDYRGRYVYRNSYTLYSGTLPSRQDSRLRSYVSQLTLYALRREQAVYNANPSITLNRVEISVDYNTLHNVDNDLCHIYTSHNTQAVEWSQQYSTLGFPTAGLYVGDYGAHGNEILYITYENEYELVAYKVTGDANVPSSYVTFRIDLREDNIREQHYTTLNLSQYDLNMNINVSHELGISALLVSRQRPLENHRMLPDVNRLSNPLIIHAAAGHDIDINQLHINEMNINIDQQAATTEEQMDLVVIEQMIQSRHMNSLANNGNGIVVIHTRPGQGTIALAGYQRARVIPLQAHFHHDFSFTLDFLGLVKFRPWKCKCALQHINNNVNDYNTTAQTTNAVTNNTA